MPDVAGRGSVFLMVAAGLRSCSMGRRWHRRRRRGRGASRQRGEADGAQKQPAQIRQAINSSARLLILDRRASRYTRRATALHRCRSRPGTFLRRTSRPPESRHRCRKHGAQPISSRLPDIGIGIYDREGVNAGTVVHPDLYVHARLSGARRQRRTTCRWIGNDGTFSSAATVRLPLNSPVTFPVTINPATAGVPSAILNLDDPSTAGIDYQTMNVVVEPYAFSAAEQLLGHEHKHDRPRQQKSTSSTSRRDAGVQSRLQRPDRRVLGRRGSCAGIRSGSASIRMR